jgi:hypothetical protein
MELLTVLAFRSQRRINSLAELGDLISRAGRRSTLTTTSSLTAPAGISSTRRPSTDDIRPPLGPTVPSAITPVAIAVSPSGGRLGSMVGVGDGLVTGPTLASGVGVGVDVSTAVAVSLTTAVSVTGGGPNSVGVGTRSVGVGVGTNGVSDGTGLTDGS